MTTPTIPPKVLEAIEREARKLYPKISLRDSDARRAHIAAMSRAYWMVSEAYDCACGYCECSSCEENKTQYIIQLFTNSK